MYNRIFNNLLKRLLYTIVLLTSHNTYAINFTSDTATDGTLTYYIINNAYARNINYKELDLTGSNYNTVTLSQTAPSILYADGSTDFREAYTYLHDFDLIDTVYIQKNNISGNSIASSSQVHAITFIDKTSNLNTIKVDNIIGNDNYYYDISSYGQFSQQQIIIKNCPNLSNVPCPNIYRTATVAETGEYDLGYNKYQLIFDIGADNSMNVDNYIGYQADGTKMAPFTTIYFYTGTFTVDPAKINSRYLYVAPNATMILTPTMEVTDTVYVGTMCPTIYTHQNPNSMNSQTTNYHGTNYSTHTETIYNEYVYYGDYHKYQPVWVKSDIHINNIHNYPVTYDLFYGTFSSYDLILSGRNISINGRLYSSKAPAKIIFDENSNISWIGKLSLNQRYLNGVEKTLSGLYANSNDSLDYIDSSEPNILEFRNNAVFNLQSYGYTDVYSTNQPLNLIIAETVIFNLGNYTLNITEPILNTDLRNKTINVFTKRGKLSIQNTSSGSMLVDTTSKFNFYLLDGYTAAIEDLCSITNNGSNCTISSSIIPTFLNGTNNIDLNSSYNATNAYIFDDNAAFFLNVTIDTPYITSNTFDKITTGSGPYYFATSNDISINLNFTGVDGTATEQYEIFNVLGDIHKDSFKRVTADASSTYKIGNDGIVHKITATAKTTFVPHEVAANNNYYIVNTDTADTTYNLSVLYNLETNNYTKYGISVTGNTDDKLNAGDTVNVQLVYVLGQDSILVDDVLTAIDSNLIPSNPHNLLSPLLDESNETINYSFYYLSSSTDTNVVIPTADDLHINFTTLQAQSILTAAFSSLMIDANTLSINGEDDVVGYTTGGSAINVTALAATYEQAQLATTQAITIAALNSTISERDASIVTLISEKNQLIADKVDLNTQITTLNSTVAALNIQVTDLTALASARQITINTLTADNATLTTQLNTANSELATKTADLATALASIGTLEGEALTYQTTITSLQSQISTLNTTNADQTTTISTLQAAVATLEASETALEATNADLVDDNTALTTQLNTYISDLANLQTIHDALVITNQDHIDDISTLTTQLNTANSELTTKTADLATALATIGTLEGEAITYQNTITTLQGQITTLNSQITTLNNQIATLNTTNTDQATTISTLQDNITALQTTVATLEASETALINTNATLVANNTALTTQLNTYISDLTDLQTTYDALVIVNQGHIADISTLTTQLNTANSELTTKTEDLAAALLQIGVLNEDATDYQNTITTLQGQITTLNSQITTLNTTNTDQATTISTLQGNITVLQATVATLEASETTLINTNATLVADNTALTTQLNTYIADLTSLQSTYNALVITNQGHIDDITTLTTNNSTLQSTIDTLNAAQTTLQSGFDTLQTNYNTQVAANIDLQDENNSLQTQLATTQTNLTNLQASNAVTVADLAALTTQYNTLNTQYTTLTAQKDALENENTTLQTANTILQATLDDQTATLNAQISALNTTITNLTTTNETLTTSYNTLQTDFSNLQVSNNITNESLSTLQTTYNNLQTQYTGLQAQYDSLDDATTDEIASLNSNIITLQQTITNLNADKTALNTSLTQTSAELAALQNTYTTDVADLNSQLTNLQTQYDTLEANNTLTEAQKADLETQLATIQTTVTAKNVEIATLNTNLASLQTQHDILEANNILTEAQKLALAQDLATAQATLSEKNNEITALNNLNESLTSQATNLNANITALEIQIANTPTGITSAEKQALLAQLNLLQTKYNVLEAQHIQVTSAIAKQKIIDDRNAAVAVLQSEIKKIGLNIAPIIRSVSNNSSSLSAAMEIAKTSKDTKQVASLLQKTLDMYLAKVKKAFEGDENVLSNYDKKELANIKVGLVNYFAMNYQEHYQHPNQILDLDPRLIAAVASGQEIEYFKSGPWGKIVFGKRTHDDKKTDQFVSKIFGVVLGYDFALNNNLMLSLGGEILSIKQIHEGLNWGDAVDTFSYGGMVQLNYESRNWKINSMIQGVCGVSDASDNKALLIGKQPEEGEVVGKGSYSVYGGFGSVNVKRKFAIDANFFAVPRFIVPGLEIKMSGAYDSEYREDEAGAYNLEVGSQSLMLAYLKPNLTIEFFHRVNKKLYMKFAIDGGVGFPFAIHKSGADLKFPWAKEKIVSGETGWQNLADQIEYSGGLVVVIRHQSFDLSLKYDFQYYKDTISHMVAIKCKMNL